MFNKITNNLWLILLAIVITTLSLIFTNTLVRELAKEEQKKIEVWAEATEQIANGEFSEFAFEIIKKNTNIPVLVVDTNYNLISSRILQETNREIKAKQPDYHHLRRERKTVYLLRQLLFT